MTREQVAVLLQNKFDINAIYARYLATTIKGKDVLEQATRLIQSKPRPFVKWVGGKRQLLKQFRDRGLYPPEAFDPVRNTYYEPFAGGGAVFFDLLPKHAVLSDANNELVTTYNVIKNEVEKLITSLRRHKYNREYFALIRAKDPKFMKDVEVASRFIYLNRTGFNGMYRVNSSGKFNVPFGKYNNPRICDADNLRAVSAALQDVTIQNKDYSHVLKLARKGDFIYLDPPYHPVSKTASFTSYTADSFTGEDQIKLRDAFMVLHKRGCYVMLSNSCAPFIKDIYSETKDKKVRIHDVYAGRNINSNAAGRGKVKEVVVINY